MSKRNYLFKIVKYSKEQYLEINEDRINFVTSKKRTIFRKKKRFRENKKRRFNLLFLKIFILK